MSAGYSESIAADASRDGLTTIAVDGELAFEATVAALAEQFGLNARSSGA
jgi:hypothetical protein